MTLTYLDRIAAHVSRTLRPKNVKELERRDRMAEAAATFPNDVGGYRKLLRVRDPAKGEPVDHVAVNRRQLKEAFENPPMHPVSHGRLRRARTERTKIVGIRVYGKNYKFNGPIDWEAAVSGIAVA